MKTGTIITLSAREARLKRQIRRHLHDLGFHKAPNGKLQPPSLDKDAYRRFHLGLRQEKLDANKTWLESHQAGLVKWFANGESIIPGDIRPELEVIKGGTWQSDLFRFASLYWQVPVSNGYGRRLRFLVWDRGHNKLIGIFALGDAVFNQAARDAYIGWDHHRRSQSLVNLMDAYVLGALPPYSHLLGGKLVASLVRTKEVVETFNEKYGDAIGVISGAKKSAKLVAVTTTSALGRSSIYNRHKLSGRFIFEPIGFTSGWGHFHFSGEIFQELRDYLVHVGDDYADGFEFGSGPNWRIRVIRRALARLEMDTTLARHGFVRQVFIAKIANNAEAVLRGERKQILYDDLPSVEAASLSALERWVIPRAQRDPRYLGWCVDDLLATIHGKVCGSSGKGSLFDVLGD